MKEKINLPIQNEVGNSAIVELNLAKGNIGLNDSFVLRR